MAVAGRLGSAQVLEHMLSRQVRFDILEEAGFVTSDHDRPSIRHAILGEVAYGALLRRPRRTLHHRAADAIEHIHGQADWHAADLARHLDNAGEADRAVPYYLTAARRAFAAFDTAAALELAGRGADLSTDDSATFELASLATSVLAHVGGRHDEEWELVERMTALAGDDPTLAMRATEAAIRCRLASDYAAAVEMLQDAVGQFSDEIDATVRGRVLLHWADLQRRQYAPATSVPALEQAIALFAHAGDAHGRALALGRLAGVMEFVDGSRAAAVADEALAAAEAADHPQLIGEAQLQRALIDVNEQQPAAARQALSQAIAIATDIGDSSLLRRARTRAGYVSVLLDERREADEHFLTAIALATRAEDEFGWLSAALGLVETWEAHERLGDLWEWVHEALESVPSWAGPPNQAYLYYALGYRLLRWVGRGAEAVDALERAVALADLNEELKPPGVMFRNGLANAYREVGRVEDARDRLADARQIQEEFALADVTNMYLLVTEALIALDRHDVVVAAGALDSLRQRSDQRFVGEEHATHVVAGRIALATESYDDARKHAEAAAALEPLTRGTRWFSRLQVMELLIRATEAEACDASNVRSEARRFATEHLANLPDHLAATTRLRPEVAMILSG